MREHLSHASATPSILTLTVDNPPSAFLMAAPSSPVLQTFPSLDAPLPGLQNQLNNTLRGEEYQQCVSTLQDDDLVWLVDYLDKVCHHVVRLDLHSSNCRFFLVSTLPVRLPRSVYMNSVQYAALRGYSQDRTIFRLTFSILIPTKSSLMNVICMRGPTMAQRFASNAYGCLAHRGRLKCVIGTVVCPARNC